MGTKIGRSLAGVEAGFDAGVDAGINCSASDSPSALAAISKMGSFGVISPLSGVASPATGTGTGAIATAACGTTTGFIGGRIGFDFSSSHDCIRAGPRFPRSSTNSNGLASPRANSSAIRTTADISVTSCTRTICAPFKTAAVTAAAVANSVSSSVPCARNDFRDAPTKIGNSRVANRLNCAISSLFCSLRLPNPIPGSTTIRFFSTPA